MITSLRRLPIASGLAIAFVATVILSATAAAQQPTSTGEEITYIGVIKGSSVYVRSGAAETYYPFGKVEDGDLVKVTGEKFDWARIAAAGPAFREMFGYVKYAKGDNGRVRLSQDGQSGVTLGKVDIIAPNMDAKSEPKDSWKTIVRLEADQTLRIIKKTETDKDVILSVSLPESAQGWISKAYVDRASEEQVAEWKNLLANKPTAPVAKAPPARSTQSPSGEQPAKVKPNTPVTVATNGPKPIDGSADKPTDTPNPVLATDGGSDAPTIESPDAATEGPSATEVTKPAEPIKAPEPKKLPTIDDLEAAFKVLQKEPTETAEVGPLRELYLALAGRSGNDARVSKRALGRADQLQVWADIQKKRLELDSTRARLKMNAADTAAVQKALESSAEYAAVGRVIASPIYDGERLPKLLRLQDSNGRTVAYLQPDDTYTFENLIGNLVGIVGEKSFDETLRLNVIAPKRIDLLTPDARADVQPQLGESGK